MCQACLRLANNLKHSGPPTSSLFDLFEQEELHTTIFCFFNLSLEMHVFGCFTFDYKQHIDYMAFSSFTKTYEISQQIL